MAIVDSLAVKYMKRNQKQCISFCCLLLIHVQQGVSPSPLAQWPITDLLHHLQMGWCDNYDGLTT